MKRKIQLCLFSVLVIACMGWAANPEGPNDGYTLSDGGATATLNANATFAQLKAAIAVEGVTKVVITGEITSSTELEITKEGLELVGEEGAKLGFTDAKSIVVNAKDVVLTNLNVTSTSIAVKINEEKTGTRINGGTYICSTPDAEGAGVIYFLGQNGDIYVSGATLTGKLGMYNVTGKLDGITGNTIKYTSTSSVPVVGISALFESTLPAGVISPMELAAQNKITMPANGAQYPVLYESSAWKGLDGLAYADTKDNLAALVGSGVKENVLIKLKANTKYSFTESLTIQQEGVRLEGADGAKLEFVGAGIVVDANNVAVNNLNIETSQGATITINENKTGFVLTNGTYSCSTLAGGEVGKQGESCLRFKGANGAINVTGATLVGGIYVGGCNGSLAGVKGNSISYTYEGPVSFVGISATFSGTDAKAAVVSVADLAAQNTIKMPATGMQYDVTFENSSTSPWTKFAYVVSGVPAVKDNKINLTAGSDVAYNGVVLQRAIDYAAAQSEKPEIILGAGTYQGCFVMADGVNVTGADKATTILDGNAKGRVVSYKADAAYNGSTFTDGDGVATTTTWSNLKITNGKADNAAGAIITKNVTLKNCEISANEATGKAGGVMCYLGGVIDGCLIHNNEAGDGGAGVVLDYIGTIQNSEVYSNRSKGDTKDAHSGGINTRTNVNDIQNSASDMQILNCKVYGNTAYNIAGVSLNGKATMVNTLVYGNQATGTSGMPNAAGNSDAVQGAVTFSVAGAQMINCTVWNNDATKEGAEANVSVFENSKGIVKNCIMESVTTSPEASITYSASASLDASETEAHNIKIENDDPFTNASAGDYTLAEGSKFANKGSNEAYAETYPKTDLAGNTRIQEKTIDLGAYESAYVADKPVSTGDALKEELEENKPAEIVIEAPEDGKAELTIEDAIEVDYPVTIKSSDDKPVTIKVEEGKSAFTTKAGGELTLDNVTIATTEASTTGGTAVPVIKIEEGSEATLQNSTLAVPETVTAIEASGKMTISGVELTVNSVEDGTAAPVIKVKTDGDVTIDNATIADGTIEVAGKLTIEPAENGKISFAQTSGDKPALELKSGAQVSVTNAQFTGKAIAAEAGSINLSKCNFSSPEGTKAVRMTRSTGGDATVIDAGEATATIECCIFTGIEGENPMLSGKNLTVKSCLFYDNEDMVMIDIAAEGTSVIANNTCVNNNEEAEAIINNASSTAVIKNNIFWTNADEAITGTATGDKISHNALKTAGPVTNNNLTLPSLAYIKFDNTTYKYQLHKDSPIAQITGDATGIDDDAKDILGNLRLTDDRTNKTVHLGAYESVYTPSTGGGSTGGGTGDTTPDATGIKLDKTTLTLARLQSYTLVATVEPAAAGGVKWTSTDPSVATVDANGKVTAVKVGQATIIATAINGGLTALCQVTVDFATGVEEALAESAIFGREGDIQIQPATPVEMIIVNMAGTIVAHRTISQAETISVPKGIYIVRLNSGGHVLTQKVNVR